MSNYYFLATALPPLQLGAPPEMSFEELVFLLKTNLSAQDYAKVQIIRRFYDIQNIRHFWKKEPLEPQGNLDAMELEEALIAREGFPDYVYDFLDQHDNMQSRLHDFPGLIAAYFEQESQRATGFLKEYLSFERKWRLALAGFRAKKLGRNITEELQFEDPDDDFITQIIAQKDAKSFVPPDEYEDLQPLFEDHVNSPLDLYKALCEYRYEKIEQILGTDIFSIDRILGYMAELITVEKWEELDAKKGMEIVEHVLDQGLQAPLNINTA